MRAESMVRIGAMVTEDIRDSKSQDTVNVKVEMAAPMLKYECRVSGAE